MVACARARSPFYRELYRDLPGRIEDPRQLPITDKKMLMEHFDEWCTDPDGDTLTIYSVSWGPGTSGVGGSATTIYSIGYGPETIPITVTDGQGNYTVFDWVYSRQP